MLHHVYHVAQRNANLRKLWFQSELLDLFFWMNLSNEIIAFELTYDKPCREKGLIWSENFGFNHLYLCSDNTRGHSMRTPVYCTKVNDPNIILLKDQFESENETLDSYMKEFITKKIEEFEMRIN